MKNLNIKQLEWSRKLIRKDKFKRLAFMYCLVFSVFAVQAIVSVANGNENDITTALTTGAGSATFASMAAIGDIGDVTDKYTQPDQIGYTIALIETVQIDTSVPFPQPNASREVADITLLSSEVPHFFESHNYPTYTSTGELGDFTFAPTKELMIVLGDSSRDQVQDFLEEKAGAKFIVFFKKCGDTQWKILGNTCKPMRFNNFEAKMDGDASVTVCKFGNTSMNQFYKYTGTLQQEAPVEIGADATDLAITTNSKYNTSAANAAPAVIATVSGLASADYGRTLTVYGKGGGANAHTIADNSVFILVDAATWTGNVGSSITFEIVDTNTLVEKSRVQTA